MTFASAPANDSTTQISMTATTGSDSTTPVNYFFTNDNSSCGANAGTGGTSSSWQSSTSYSDTGLQPNKCYGYTVTARDSASTPNTGTASSISSTFTSANTPGTPTLSGATATTLNLTNAENSNPSANPATSFAVQVVTTSPNDATWLNKWVNGSGNPSATAVWLTDAQLDALVLQGLTAATTYGVKVKARNQDNDETALSAEGQGTTLSTLTLADHAAGQETDKFTTASSVTGAELFAFKLTNNSGSQITISSLVLSLSSVTGIAQGDFANLAIYEDTNGDGAISGESTTVGGAGVVNATPSTITFSTSFNIAASTTKNYILKGNVSNLVGNDTITLALTSGNVTLGAGTISGSATNVTHTADYTVTLANHAAGQETDKFTTASSVTGAELFAFKLTNNSGSQVTISSLVLSPSSVTGIVQGDFASLAIYVDSNNDGTIGGGETTAVGGTGAVNAGVTTITFSTSFDIAASSTVNYILKGDVSNLAAGDTVTIGLTSGNVTVSGGSISGSTTSVAHTADAATIGASLKSSITDATDANSYAFPSGAYSNNVLYICFTSTAIASGTAPSVTGVSGAGLTFTEIGTAGGLLYSGTVRRIQAWRALVTSGATTGVVTASLDGTSTGMGAAILEFTGTKTSGTNGADAVVQYNTSTGTSVSGLTVTLGAFSDSNNRPVAFFSHRANEATSNEAGYTELYDGNNSAPLMGYEAEWHATVADTTPSVTWATSENGGGFALEIALASAATLTLANHDAGQVADKFASSTPVTDVLTRFKLTASGSVTVTNLRVNFTTAGGVDNGDVTACQLYSDANSDGAVDGGDSLIQGSVTPSGGVITFTTDFSPSESGTNCLVRCTVANLVENDTTTVSVGTADIDESGTVTESGSISNATHTANATGTVQRLDANWATATNAALSSYTAPSGTSRLLVFVAGMEKGADSDITGVTYGGVAMTQAVDYIATEAGVTNRVEIWYLRDAQIPAGSNSFVATYANGTPGFYAYVAATYQYVDQISPILNTNKNQDSTDPHDNPLETTVTVGTGGMAVAVATCANDGSYTWGTWTEVADISTGSTQVGVAEKAITADGTATASATFTGTVYREVIAAASFNPASCGFAYSRTLTVQAGQVSIGPHTNFPMLVNITSDTNLRTVANGGHVTSASGYDIIFRANDDATCGGAGTSPCTLDHEIEKYDPATGQLIAWMRVPSINDGTAITMLYGNSCITVSTEHKSGVWNANYMAVYHLSQSPAGTVLDSTGNHIDLTPAGGMGAGNLVAAEIGDGISFDGSDDRLVSTSTFTMTSFTVEAWISSNDWGTWHSIVDVDSGSTPYRDLTINGTGQISVNNDNDYPVTDSLSLTTWRHVAATFNGTNSLRGFLNGAQTSYTPSPPFTAITGRVIIGAWFDYDPAGFHDFWNGKMDEVRISNTPRTAGWIATEFNNMNAPGSFLSLGTEAGTCANNYAYSRTITVQAGKVSGGAQLNFPMLVNITSDTNLRTVANGGNVTNASGYDIIFKGTDDTTCGGAGTSPCILDHEIEKYDQATGQLVAWVRVPSINNGTVITMLYGNSCITASMENKTGVWNSSYEGVWHLNETPADNTTGGHKDSTSYANDGTPQSFQDGDGGSTNATGIAAGADLFANGSPADDRIEIGDNSSLEPTGDLTVEAWVKFTSFPSNPHIVYKRHGSSPYYAYMLYVDVSDVRPHFQWVNGSGTAYDAGLSSGSLSTGTWYHLVGVHEGTTTRIYINGSNANTTTATTSGSLLNSDLTLNIGASWSGGTCPNGTIDEVRVSSTNRSAGWIATEYNNVSAPLSFYSLGSQSSAGATAITLVSFTATGEGAAVRVAWQTAQEVNNLGFNLYRAGRPEGPYVKLNPALIPGLGGSVQGQSYSYLDRAVVRGALYYYRLEDVETTDARRNHGPICVDWDGDGMPDDWERAYELNPLVNDAGLDSDGDGVPNLLEYQRGTDPFNRDSDGDGTLDGAEKKEPGSSGGVGSLEADASVQVLVSDSRGMTLELLTKSFDVTPVEASGQAFERLRVPAYVHGYTLEAGLPQVPLKGVLVDIPAGKQARVEVLEADSRVLAGYRVYPAPVFQAGANNQVAEVFSWDEAAYQRSAYYPAVAAELSSQYVFRSQSQQRLVFYPLRFNPGTGELLHYERIRVRVTFVEASAQAAATAGFQAPLAAVGWAIPAGAAYKVSTEAEGIYRVTRDWLTAQGLGSAEIDAINLGQVQLFNLGAEQAIDVYDQNGNSRLDAGDYISFYATAVPAAYAKYARYNVYWLIDAGSASPLRMGTIDGTPLAGSLAGSHQSLVHYELDKGYLQNSPGPDGMDRWLFPAVALGPDFEGGGTAKSFTLTLAGVAGTGELAIRLYSPCEMNHTAAVSLNGTGLGSATWSGAGFTVARFAGVSLLEGDNTVAISCQIGQDKIYFDWFEADYERSFTAAADSLKFTHAGGARYMISDFSTDDIELFEISDAAAVKRVVNGTTSGSGPYGIEVEPAGATGSPSYLALAAAGLKRPAAIVRDRASMLASATNAADWILITHRDIGWEAGGAQQNWVASLVGLRQSQGLRTAVVDVADIFDEFGYGLVSPQAIKDFITYAYENWQPPGPQYVLLMGDTTYDYKDNRNLVTLNYVPGYLIYTTYLGETISDDWYVQVSGADAVPDLYIGRLPANSAAQAEDMVAKIVSYETSANAKSWEKSVVLVADNLVEDWEGVFETMNEDAAAFLPAGMATPERFYLQEYENESLAVADLSADLVAAINAGALIVNYSGHGSVNLWATEHIIDNQGGEYRSDVSSLSNSGMYPFVVNMTCLTGYFIYPSLGGYAGSGWLSLAEGFMLPATHGAIAALMPTGMTDSDGQQVLSRALYEGIFALDKRRLGPAVSFAKQQLLANGGAAYEEISNTFLFFGDPATTLKVPLPRRPAGLTAEQAGGTVVLSWAAALDCDGHAVAGYNLYRRLSTEETYTRLNAALITALSYTDTGLSAAPVGATYYYVLSAVDAASEESVKSAPAALTIADSIGGDGDAGGGDGDGAGGNGGGGGDGGSGDGGSGGGGSNGAPNGHGRRNGCFISAAGLDLSPELLMPFGVMALLGCLIWISRRRRGGQ